MGQGQPFTATDDTMWLSRLVGTMDRVEQLHDEPCNTAVTAAALARLQRPATNLRDTTRLDKMLELSF